RARPRAGQHGGRPLHRGGDRRALGGVARGVEDDDIGRPDARPEGLQRALIRLVGRLTRDREALVPALRDLPGGEGAEESEDDPGADHLPAIPGDYVSATSQHYSPSRAKSFSY